MCSKMICCSYKNIIFFVLDFHIDFIFTIIIMNVNQNHGNIDSLDSRPVASCSGSQVQSSMVRFPSGQTTTRISSRKKCHGNKKLQRFRKRRRARGMSEEAINKIIQARKREKEQNQAKQQQQQQKTTTSNTTQSIKTTDNIISVRLLKCDRH